MTIDAPAADAAATFEPHRRALVGLAYRMLGSVAEAEDVAQDAFLRWLDVERAQILEPRAYLLRVVSRLCLDRMKTAHAKREAYVGTWLPEPMIGEGAAAATATTIADDLTVAFLLTLERLSPLERAAFLLHDVFDMDYDALAGVLERSEAACRQLAARGREHVRAGHTRFAPTEDATARLAGAFYAAVTTGDLPALARVLADDAVFYSDGGGKRAAAINPVYGKDKILRLLVGLAGKRGIPTSDQLRVVVINGMPGVIVQSDDGVETVAIDIAGDQIVAIYAIRNPDKLRHLT